jgi:hypothetical protein
MKRTYQKYHSEKTTDFYQSWRRTSTDLKPMTPPNTPILLEPKEEDEITVIAKLVMVLE